MRRRGGGSFASSRRAVGRGRAGDISDSSSPSRRPRSATRTRSHGQASCTACRMAAPARTRSARSGADAGLGRPLRHGHGRAAGRRPPRTPPASSTGRPPWRGHSAAGRRCRPARLVMAPEVPTRCASPASKISRKAAAPSKAQDARLHRLHHGADSRRDRSGGASANRSARETTPMGIESQARIGSFHGPDGGDRRRARRPTDPATTARSSRRPRPAPGRRAPCGPAGRGSRRRRAAPLPAGRSGAASARSRRRPGRRTPAPLAAERQAWVATARTRLTPAPAIFSAQMVRADRARSMAPSESRPLASTPSPRRTMREKASTMRKPRAVGRGDQQAAVVGAEIDRGEGRCATAAGRAGPTRASEPRPHYARHFTSSHSH